MNWFLTANHKEGKSGFYFFVSNLRSCALPAFRKSFPA